MSAGKHLCLFCGKRADSKEHIFKRDYRNTLGIAEVDREFTQTDKDGNITRRPDPIFNAQVHGVCHKCNRNWMNQLDLHVEEWVINPDDRNAYQACDPKEFRRWAIKLALMRSLLDSATAVPKDYFKRLLNGDDPAEWHVFVGRADFREWRHTFSIYGFGSDQATRSMSHGLIHVSWSLGAAVVSTVCVHGGDPAKHFLPDFRIYNTTQGGPLAEVPHGVVSLPDIFTHRKFSHGQTEPFFMFFTDKPASPIAVIMRRVQGDLRAAIDRQDPAAQQSRPR